MFVVMGRGCAHPADVTSSYNDPMRRKSAIDEAKQKDRIERARRMTPEARLQACIRISHVALELRRAGERYRQTFLEKLRP